MATKSVKIKYGKLTEPLQRFTVKVETTLGDFLDRHEIEYGSAIRVNGNTATRKTILQENDIITNIDNVSGGR